MQKFISSIKSCNFKTELVPVIFVDNSIILENAYKNLESFKALKFNFLLLDTFSKENGDLFKNCSLNYLSNFLEQTSKLGLSVGLAGKLKQNQIPKLLKLRPKIIGLGRQFVRKIIELKKISDEKLKKFIIFF